MAKPNFQKLKEVYIDGIATQVPDKSRIIDVVGTDVTAVEAFNPNAGKMELITRERFNQNLPEGITTHLTPIEKGGHDDWDSVGDGWHLNKRPNGWLICTRVGVATRTATTITSSTMEGQFINLRGRS